MQKALTIILKNFPVIITHFDHIRGGRIGNAEVQGKSTNISKNLKDYTFLYVFLNAGRTQNESQSTKRQHHPITVFRIYHCVTFLSQ